MKKLIFIISLLFCYNINASVNLLATFNKLKHSMNLDYVKLYVKNSNELNAGASLKYVIITTAMLQTASDNGELALILSHELSHIKNKDYLRKQGYLVESSADILGAKYMQKDGYNVCQSLFMMKKLQALMIKSNGDDGVHPAWLIRYNSLKHYCYGGKKAK